MSYCLYHQAHFLFAYRYFEVAEMFGRKNKTMQNHIKVRKVTGKISYVVIGLIAINYLLSIANVINYRINGQFSDKIDNWTYVFIPTMFLIADCVLLLIGLVWICKSLKHDPQVMGNEKWMCLHTILLIITIGAWNYYSVGSLISIQINTVCNSVVYLLMGLIMNQVNYPEKMVWAHLKLDTNDKEEIMPYLNRNRSSLSDEYPEELLSDRGSEEDKPISLLEVDYSIFEEPILSESLDLRNAELIDPPNFCSILDSISELDGYGASIISLLSKARSSIPIDYREEQEE
jgi:hypothetical protein